jgi:hypothetical protein
MQYPIPGPNLVAEYQVSGLPFATSSAGGVVRFPYVTQWIWIHPTGGGTTTVGFTQAGLGSNNFFTVHHADGPTPVFPWKLKEIWISGSAEVVAGLTMVPPSKMWDYVHPPASGSVDGPAQNTTAFGYDGI